MKDLNAAAHVYVTIISQASERNNTLSLELLSSELKFYQNVVINLTQSFKLLHKFVVHYIEIENEDIFYEFLYIFCQRNSKCCENI